MFIRSKVNRASNFFFFERYVSGTYPFELLYTMQIYLIPFHCVWIQRLKRYVQLSLRRSLVVSTPPRTYIAPCALDSRAVSSFVVWRIALVGMILRIQRLKARQHVLRHLGAGGGEIVMFSRIGGEIEKAWSRKAGCVIDARIRISGVWRKRSIPTGLVSWADNELPQSSVFKSRARPPVV